MKGDFLDFEKEHKLSEMECELITMFRTLSKMKQQAVFKSVFQLTVQQNELREQRRNKKTESVCK